MLARSVVADEDGPLLPFQRSGGRRQDLGQVRKWAADNGVELSTRGRIAASVLAAYDAKDVAALRAATGQEKPSRGRRRGRTRAS